MKRILITGADSYIGTYFERYIKNFSDKYSVDTLDMRANDWQEKSFQGYDVVFHVAGIAHSDNGKVSKERERLYYAVNTELAISTAKKAKEECVKQFIFMSSAIVYGKSAPIGKSRRIDKNTPLTPENCYGDSKKRAEEGLFALESDGFKIVALRPPMIYGERCKGNYVTLSKLAKKMRIMPFIKNERSMIYIGNFVEFVRLIIENGEGGVFMPQNAEYVDTIQMMKAIAAVHGKKILTVKGFGWAVKLASYFLKSLRKAFGSFAYEYSASSYKEKYTIYSFEESIRRTEER